jgi:AraC family transcriptional regulator
MALFELSIGETVVHVAASREALVTANLAIATSQTSRAAMASKERSVSVIARQLAETLRSEAPKLPSVAVLPFHCLASCLAQLLETARREFDSDQDAAKASLLTASYILQSEIERHSEANGSRPLALAGWQIVHVRAFIEKNLHRNINTRDLSVVAQRSQAHFSRSFKQAFGEPPHAYVIKRRLTRACHLMVTSPEPLSSIALSVGFSDHAHLCRHFRRAFAQSPSRWRREHGAPQVISRTGIGKECSVIAHCPDRPAIDLNAKP